MTDEELIAWMRERGPRMITVDAEMVSLATDRIEALMKERDEYKRLAIAGELAARECRIWQQQAEAAEAESVRLRETLTTIKGMGTTYGNATVRRITAFAAAALKGDSK